VTKQLSDGIFTWKTEILDIRCVMTMQINNRAQFQEYEGLHENHSMEGWGLLLLEQSMMNQSYLPVLP
jgi:hypothetical protein